MALAVSVRLVVDDAIVMIENVVPQHGEGLSAVAAQRLEGARQIGFTVISMQYLGWSRGLHSAPVHGRDRGPRVPRILRSRSYSRSWCRQSWSLTVTPMICAHYVRSLRARSRRASTASSSGFYRG